MSDRLLGYILMALTLLLAGGATAYFLGALYKPTETLTLRFPEVGSLAVEDPIRMEGTQVGEITGFDHDDSARVLVYVSSPQPIPIRTSSRIAVKVKGVMGERFIEITAGNPDDPLVDRTQIIDGKFEMGPSEAIAYMDMLNEKIIELKDIMLWLRDGKDDGKRPFIVAFNDIVGTIDTVVYNLLTGISGLETGLSDGLDMAADIAEKAARLTANVSAKTPEIIESVNDFMVKVDRLIPVIDTALTKISAIAEKTEENKILWGDHAEKLQKSLAEIRTFVDEMRREGLPLNIRLRFF